MCYNRNQQTRICTWNCRGINNKYFELLHFLNTYEIDVLLATETKLAPNIHFNVPGYKIYRADHPSNDRKGGSAILIKSLLPHNELPPLIEMEYQVSRIQITTNGHRTQIGSFYSAPINKMNMADFWGIIHEMKTNFVIGGDFNSKHPRWGSNTSNPRGKLLHNIVYQHKLGLLHPIEPTHYPDDGSTPDVLDFFITKNLDYCSHPSVLHDLSSDHYPVLTTMSTNTLDKTSIPTLIKHPFDWTTYTTTLEQHTDLQIPLKTTRDIDIAVSALTRNIQEAANEANSFTKEQRPINKKTTSQSLHITQLHHIKKQCRRLWEQTRYPPYKTNYNRATRELKEALKLEYYSSSESELQTLNTQDKSL